MTGPGESTPPLIDPGDQVTQQPVDPAELFAGPLTPETHTVIEATMHRVAGTPNPATEDLAALDGLASSVVSEEVFVQTGNTVGGEVVMEPVTVYSRTLMGKDGKPYTEEIDSQVGRALTDYKKWRQPSTDTGSVPGSEDSYPSAAKAHESGPSDRRMSGSGDGSRPTSDSVKPPRPQGRRGTSAGGTARTSGSARGSGRPSSPSIPTQPSSSGNTSPQTPPTLGVRAPQPPAPGNATPQAPSSPGTTAPRESADDILARLERNLGLVDDAEQKRPPLDVKYGLAETQVLGPDAVLLQQHKLRRPPIRDKKGNVVGYGKVQANHIFGTFNSLPTATKSSRSPARAAEESARLFLDAQQPRTLEEALSNMQEAMELASCATGRYGERNNAEGIIGQLLEFDGKQYLVAGRSGDGSMAIYRDGVVADTFGGTDILFRSQHPSMDAEIVIRQLSPGDKVMVVSAGMFEDGHVPRHGLEDIFEMKDLDRASAEVLDRYGRVHEGTAQFRQKAALMVEVGDISQRTEDENVPIVPAGSVGFPRPGADRGLLTDGQLRSFEGDHGYGERRDQPPSRVVRARRAARIALQQLITGHPVRAVDWPKKELKAAKQRTGRARHHSVLPGSSKPSATPRETPSWLRTELRRRGY